jgi:hypothetical protein
MTTITKKQSSLALVLVAFATIMIAGSIASGTGNAFANGDEGNFNDFNHFDHFNPFDFFHHHHHHGKHSSIHQGIIQSCDQNQHSIVLSAGAFSPIINSGNNIAGCSNINSGGNAAAIDQ